MSTPTTPPPDAMKRALFNEREFYELAQAYRHTPVTEFVGVRDHYDTLVAYVRAALRDERERALDEAARVAKEMYGPYFSKGYRTAGTVIADAILELKGKP